MAFPIHDQRQNVKHPNGMSSTAPDANPLKDKSLSFCAKIAIAIFSLLTIFSGFSLKVFITVDTINQSADPLDSENFTIISIFYNAFLIFGLF